MAYSSLPPALLQVIDISRPISSKTAVFPGDAPFSCVVTDRLEENGSVNLTAMTMSPHIGTHADSPSHIVGSMKDWGGMIGQMPLEPFIGPVTVIDLSPFKGAISADDVDRRLPNELAERVLFKTNQFVDCETIEDDYAHFTPGLIDYMAMRGVMLLGIDTISVDHTDSKALEAHNQLLHRGMYWLESLDLSRVEQGNYFLVALPLKFMELEAWPVRAVLLTQR